MRGLTIGQETASFRPDAAQGKAGNQRKERGTFHVVDDEGTNNWVANPNGRDLRLIEKMPPTEVASLIENYMMHQPSIK